MADQRKNLTGGHWLYHGDARYFARNKRDWLKNVAQTLEEILSKGAIKNVEEHGLVPALSRDIALMMDTLLESKDSKNEHRIRPLLLKAVEELEKKGAISPTQREAIEGSLRYGELSPEPDYSKFSQFFRDFANGKFNEERHCLIRALAEEKMRLKKPPAK
ncbi:hypothetical protein [Candidatus Tokpelaia sp.]|uniref:hypothetical protein n=1 Tax=Candidatus Tokpelaia sp. TaxID=2233777 RepID=UPI00126CC8B9|nr:hypothetical protein [Candidatus Tokpelaia sp.]KAA6406008.1 hypothetical protein DPQ22_01680 [Candidatus Tokpelaia sp.]